MIRFVLLFLSCVAIVAQRTPVKVNGQTVNNPNLTNTPSITWSTSGANLIGTLGNLPSIGSTYTNAAITNMAANTDTDAYTIPSGYRAILKWNVFTTNSTSTTYRVQVKTNGIYYLVSQVPSVTLTAPSANISGNFFIFDEGETIAARADQTGVSVLFGVQLFSTSFPLRSVRLISVSSGNNTLYTPTSCHAGVIPSISAYSAASGGMQIRPVNLSGASITYTYLLDSTQISQQAVATVIPSAGSPANGAVFPFVPSGSSVIVNSPTNAAGQFIYMTVYEVP